MPTAQKQPSVKNELWTAYQADPVVRLAIQKALERIDLYRYWLDTASWEGYYLPDAKGRFIRVFITILPESAPFFELPIPKKNKMMSGQLLLGFD